MHFARSAKVGVLGRIAGLLDETFGVFLLRRIVWWLRWGRFAQRVCVGTHELCAIVAGSGSPTVVFESGAGNTMDVWSLVHPSVVKDHRVVVYERSGIGASEASPCQNTPAEMATELHALLQSAVCGGPVVLVGHSFGALCIREYVSQFPEEVVAVVYVEPTCESFLSELEALYPATFEEQIRFVAHVSEAANREVSHLLSKRRQTRGALVPAAIPTVVLSGLRQHRGLDPEILKLWERSHSDLAAHSSRSVHLRTRRSGHEIMVDEPRLVVQAIRDVIAFERSMRDLPICKSE